MYSLLDDDDYKRIKDWVQSSTYQSNNPPLFGDPSIRMIMLRNISKYVQENKFGLRILMDFLDIYYETIGFLWQKETLILDNLGFSDEEVCYLIYRNKKEFKCGDKQIENRINIFNKVIRTVCNVPSIEVCGHCNIETTLDILNYKNVIFKEKIFYPSLNHFCECFKNSYNDVITDYREVEFLNRYLIYIKKKIDINIEEIAAGYISEEHQSRKDITGLIWKVTKILYFACGLPWFSPEELESQPL